LKYIISCHEQTSSTSVSVSKCWVSTFPFSYCSPSFKIASSLELNTSTFLFTKLGSTFLMASRGASTITQSVRYIDSMVKITGMKTGYSIDVPIRFVKTITS